MNIAGILGRAVVPCHIWIGFLSFVLPIFVQNQNSANQIVSEDEEINRTKKNMLDLYVEYYIEYAQNLLAGPEPDPNQIDGGLLEMIPTQKAVPIEIEFTRKYFRESVENLPGK